MSKVSWVMFALYVASRLPLMGVGFGAESDTWSVVAVGRLLIASGRYVPSRFPGHPLHEIVYGIAAGLGGPLLSNTLNLICSVLLLLVVRRLAGVFNVKNRMLVAATLAVQPLFWITSADSSDFMLASLLGHSAVLAAASRRPIAAGVACGLATATRIECGLFGLVGLLLLPRGLWRRLLVPASGTAVLAFLPVLVYYMGSPVPLWAIHMPGMTPGRRLVLWAAGLWTSLGLFGWVALTLLSWFHRGRFLEYWRRRDPLLRATALLVVAFLVITLIHPTKATYLSPILPMTFLALSRVAAVRWRMAMLALCFSYSLVYLDVVDRTGQSIHPVTRLNNGLVVKDFVARWNANQAGRMIDRHRPEGISTIVLAYWLPMWLHQHPQAETCTELPTGLKVDPRHNACFHTEGLTVVHNMDEHASRVQAVSPGGLAYGESVDGYLQQEFGYDIRRLGAYEIRVREIDTSVAERFTLFRLLACVPAGGAWALCVNERSLV